MKINKRFKILCNTTWTRSNNNSNHSPILTTSTLDSSKNRLLSVPWQIWFRTPMICTSGNRLRITFSRSRQILWGGIPTWSICPSYREARTRPAPSPHSRKRRLRDRWTKGRLLMVHSHHTTSNRIKSRHWRCTRGSRSHSNMRGRRRLSRPQKSSKRVQVHRML